MVEEYINNALTNLNLATLSYFAAFQTTFAMSWSNTILKFFGGELNCFMLDPLTFKLA